MGVPFQEVESRFDSVAPALFRDPAVRSVGIGGHEDGFGLFVVRNSALIVPQNAPVAAAEMAGGIPLVIRNTPHEVEHHLKAPHPLASTIVIERTLVRPLCAGLQIQNFDDDVRTGQTAKGFIVIGSVGCFVKLASGKVALLSNNHVVAAENHGVKGSDRIQQPGNVTFDPIEHIATLTDFVPIRPSAPGATFAAGNAVMNDVDAGVASLQPGVAFHQGYHPTRNLPVPVGIARPQVNDRVFKVGRTTGLTHGVIRSVTTVVVPVPYRDGPSWFQHSMTIEGVNGTMFSDHGDSGSAIVNANKQIVGLLYAGNGSQTYACPIDAVFNSFGCTLA